VAALRVKNWRTDRVFSQYKKKTASKAAAALMTLPSVSS